MIGQAEGTRPATGQRIAFLSYVGRSGSTVFANRLASASHGAAVVPEMRTLEFLLALPSSDLGDVTAEWLTSTIKSDVQLTQYLAADTDIEQLCEQLIATSDEWADLILGLAALALESTRAEIDDAQAVVFKFGDAVFGWPGILQKVPKANLIYVHRHPCAVVNSQLNTKRAYRPEENMGRSDPWHCAATWARHVDRSMTLDAAQIRVSFDEVISGSAVVRIISEWQLSPGSSFSFSPADRESSLHRLVNRPGDESRTAAWQDELQPKDARLVASLAGDIAGDLGYELPPDLAFPELQAARIRHYVRLVQHLQKRLRDTANNPQLIVRHARSRLRRYLPQSKDNI